jgi:DNA-binding Lrp family transcriptional regulator
MGNQELEINLDAVDRSLLNCLQSQFPIDREPFIILGKTLGISEEDVIHRIEGLKDQGIVRLISPVFNARSLGYQISLVAARVAENRLDKAAEIFSAHAGVGHCYQRDYKYNLWSTLALPSTSDMQSELQRIRERIGADVVFDLPTLKTFKIVTYFDANGEGCPGANDYSNPQIYPSGDSNLSTEDRMLINELQHDLPLVQRPFDIIAERLGMRIDGLLEECRSLLQRGIMRRFGASISHQSIGYVANAMACWVAPQDALQQAGETLANLQEVSHCYERKVNPLWPYNLFSMIHAHTRETCHRIAESASRDTGIEDYVLLFSTKEYKKARIIYHV